MKKNLSKIILFLMAITLAVNFTSCKQEENKTLTVSSTQETVTNEAGTFSLNVTSNTDWTVTSNETWCTVSANATSNDGVVTVNYEKNMTATERTCNIVVTGTDVAVVTISVMQEAGVEKSFVSKVSNFFINTPEYNRVEDYFYDSDYFLLKYEGSDNSKMECEYNNNLLIKLSYFDIDGLTNYFTFEYNSNNRIETKSYYNDLNSSTFVKKSWQTFFYEGDKIIKIENYRLDGTLKGYNEYDYDANNNMIKNTRYNINADGTNYKIYESSYTFDDKNYIFNNITSKWEPRDFNKNNYLTNAWVFYDEYGNTTTSFETTYTYDYNEDNYPVKRTRDGEDYIEYEYIKAF